MVDAENCWYNHSGEDAYCCDYLKFVNDRASMLGIVTRDTRLGVMHVRTDVKIITA